MTEPVFGSEKKGSIRDIPLPGTSGSEEPKALNLQKKEKPTVKNDLKGWEKMGRKNKKRGPKIAAALIIFLVLFFIISGFVHKAEIDVTPRQESAAIAQTFKASNTGEEGTLAFSRVSPLNTTETFFIKGSIEENVQTKASGKITVKNTTDSSQRFIPNTRFETPAGLVYRTPRSVVIPAQGETEITVIADIPGSEYNAESGMTFKLPGLEGTPGYNTFSAFQSGPMTGGFSGVITTATEDEIEAGTNTVTAQLEQKLQNELLKKIPSGFIVTTDMMSISKITVNTKPNQDKGGIDLVAEGAIEAVMFKKESFDNFVASSVLKDYTPGQSVTITNSPDITMRIITDDFDVAEDNEFEFSLRSPKEGAQFVWNIQIEAVKEAVAGQDESFVTQGLVTEIAGSGVATVSISPFWKSKIPKNINKIEVTINNSN